MFILSKISDNVRILPLNFKMPKAEALADELNKKFANKVVHNVGLCIRLFDIVHIGEPFVLPNDGSTYTKGWRLSFHPFSFSPQEREPDFILSFLLSDLPDGGVSSLCWRDLGGQDPGQQRERSHRFLSPFFDEPWRGFADS